MNKKILQRVALWVLILVAAGIAFWTSFRNAIEMASIVRTDADGILRVTVMNSPEDPAGTPLRLRLEYNYAEKRGADGKALPMPFPQPFSVVLVDENANVITWLGAPDEQGALPAVDVFPRNEKYLRLGFPKITEDGKPVSLLIRNPFYSE